MKGQHNKKKELIGVCLTIKETLKIADLLDTLAAMAGVPDEEFTRKCKQAGSFSNHLKEIVITNHSNINVL